jgi:hypothetical protein
VTQPVANCGAGDLLRIIGNEITGPGWGVDVNFQAGASSLIVQQNSISSGGGIHIGGNAVSTRILQNEIEPTYGFATATALIDVDGEVNGAQPASGAQGVLISGNSFQTANLGPNGQTLPQDGVRVNYAVDTTIVDNYFERASGRNDVVVTSNATNTIVGTNVFAQTGALALSDSGSGTVTAVVGSTGFTVGGNWASPAVPVKLDGSGSFYLAAAAACLASGTGDRFLTWSGAPTQTCSQACSTVTCGATASCVQGWSVVSGTTNYRYGTECDTGSGPGISGKLCCCTGTGCGQPMYR